MKRNNLLAISSILVAFHSPTSKAQDNLAVKNGIDPASLEVVIFGPDPKKKIQLTREEGQRVIDALKLGGDTCKTNQDLWQDTGKNADGEVHSIVRLARLYGWIIFHAPDSSHKTSSQDEELVLFDKNLRPIHWTLQYGYTQKSKIAFAKELNNILKK